MRYRLALMAALIVCLPSSFMALPYRPIENTYLHSLSTRTMPIDARRILSNIIQGKAQATPYLIKEFWKEMEAYGPFTDEKRIIMRDRLAGEAIILSSYVYRDMLISIYVKDYYESEKRKAYEQHLLEIAVITTKIISSNKKSIEKYMAMDETIQFKRGEVRKTRSSLQGLITKMSILEKQVNRLFKIPEPPKTHPKKIPDNYKKEFTKKEYRQGFLEDKTL